MTVLRTERLVPEVGGDPVLDGVDLSVAAGDSLGLVGPGGSGRTSLLHVLATLRAPHAGRLEIAGIDARRFTFAARAHVMYVGGVPPAPAGLRVREYFAFVRKTRAGQAGATSTVETALRRSELSADARVDDLSPGLGRQLALAAALMAAPRLLVLDDPLAWLDDAARRRYGSWLHERRSGGMTTIAAVGTPADADALGARVLRIDRGRIGSA